MTILLIDIVVVRFDAFVCTLIFETNNAILSPKYNIFIIGSISCPRFQMFRGLSVNPISCRVIMYIRLAVMVRDISLPVAQLFVIAIENILRGDVGNLTSLYLHVSNVSVKG